MPSPPTADLRLPHGGNDEFLVHQAFPEPWTPNRILSLSFWRDEEAAPPPEKKFRVERGREFHHKTLKA